MNGDGHEIYERLNKIEVDLGRHDERLTSMGKMVDEIKKIVNGLQVKVAGIVAIVTLLVQWGFEVWGK